MEQVGADGEVVQQRFQAIGHFRTPDQEARILRDPPSGPGRTVRPTPSHPRPPERKAPCPSRKFCTPPRPLPPEAATAAPCLLTTRWMCRSTRPRELGGNGAAGTNPEQLFAAGYSACFLSALQFVAGKEKVALPADSKITGRVGIGPLPTGFGIEAELRISVPGLPRETGAGAGRQGAHRVPVLERHSRQHRCEAHRGMTQIFTPCRTPLGARVPRRRRCAASIPSDIRDFHCERASRCIGRERERIHTRDSHSKHNARQSVQAVRKNGSQPTDVGDLRLRFPRFDANHRLLSNALRYTPACVRSNGVRT